MLGWLALVLAGCGGSADLPAGWEGAERIADFSQNACSGDSFGETVHEKVVVAALNGSVRVEYDDAQFRCNQNVEGFARTSSGGLDVLVQPVDMDPTEVARCDCLYDVSMTIDGLATGATKVGVYRRWDNINTPNDPVRVGSSTVEIR